MIKKATETHKVHIMWRPQDICTCSYTYRVGGQ